ncbi:hypothetical protein TanjilG_19948 [Lupinus angustifolius]|uniref:Uncharacterized protein n=1 Tax=Lupinus angustifolius TaxID=3871 RepID=A0A1J7FNP2_LUPAN|nr:hypothetical protein TanjilG_19948 [Lupinus angustifolius]
MSAAESSATMQQPVTACRSSSSLFADQPWSIVPPPSILAAITPRRRHEKPPPVVQAAQQGLVTYKELSGSVEHSTIRKSKQSLNSYIMMKYIAIACRNVEVFIKFARASYKEKIWDHAAAVIIIQEVGGLVTYARGYPLDFSCNICSFCSHVVWNDIKI